MKKIFIVVAVLSLFLAACSKNDNTPGRLVLKVTDCPFPIGFVESATVTITKIEIRQAGEYHSRYRYTMPPEGPQNRERDRFIVLSEDTVTIDLLNLRNGITQELLNLEIPQGTYDLIRLYVSDAGLKIKEHSTPFRTKVPSGSQTGIKIFIKPPLVVEGGLTTELLLDFDLSRSFVMMGNMHHPSGINGFIFKPVIRAVNNSTAGRVEGVVTDTSRIKLADAHVWLKQDTIVATAFTNENGYYAMIGIPSGTYSVFATKENYDTVCVKDIKVTAANRSVVNFALTPQ